MKTILHFTDQNELKLLNHHILGLAHLITYTVPCMNGDYEDRVVVYKNHAGNQGKEISHSQLKILQDCVLNDKPQPEFMKTNTQKALEIAKEIKKDNIASFYQARLAKMEGDLFPSGYVDCPGLVSYPYDNIEDRFSRIEKMLGVVKSPGDISLARLENVEYHFYGITTRLGNLEIAIFPTQKDVDHMRPVITLEGRFKRLEEKLGIFGCVTRYGNLSIRLEKIESAWNFTKKAYVCPVLKHQQALQDALQDAFGKTYVPKFPIGYKYGHENGTNWIKEIIGFGIGSDGISPTYKSKFINKVGDSEEYAQNVDERYGKLLELIKPHLEYLGTINTPYVPKFKAGDIIISKNGEHSLEFSIGDAGVRMYYGKLHYVILGDFHECSDIDKKYKLKTLPVALEG